MSSSDDEEVSEDLTLKIVEKSLLMRAAKLIPDKYVSNEQRTNGFFSGLDKSNKGKQRVKLDRDLLEENDREELKSAAIMSSSDDEEANEDLTLKIVEKSLLMRAAKLIPDKDVSNYERTNEFFSGLLDLPSSSSANASQQTEVKNVASVDLEKKKIIKKVKSRKLKKEIGDSSVFVAKEEEKMEEVEEADVAGTTETNPVEISDNMTNNLVLKKLLRGPRYFDPPDSSWGTCYNCGEEGHAAVNCTAGKRRKPCFVCGSLEHNVRQCTKGKDCYICKGSGHRAKDCPEKQKGSFVRSKVCLKCGDSGHDMFSCWNYYPDDDLKVIQCYMCKSFGHLCCAKYVNSISGEVSCYKCGQQGHTGLACSKVQGETAGTESLSSCFRCGEVGHFARECTSSAKVSWRNREPSTPTRFHKVKNSGFRSAPHDVGKDHKRKKTHHELSGATMPRKSKHRGGWIMDDPGDYSPMKSGKNSWKSSATPSKGWKVSSASSHTPNSRSYKKNHMHYGTPNSQGSSMHYGHSGSRFSSSSSDRNRRNYDRW